MVDSTSTSGNVPSKRALAWSIVSLLIAAVTIFAIIDPFSPADTQSADIGSQGTEADPVAIDGATLERRPDGLRVVTDMPTPAPGSYEYPESDMVPPGSSDHPEVLPGGPEEPETYTLWIFIFNYPEHCTEACNDDDLDPNSPAKGGVYQGDGRIADSDQLVLEAGIRAGQEPARGSPLENPRGAEVHATIAPHGKALTGRQLERQLNGPIGNPTLWWGARFPAPGS